MKLLVAYSMSSTYVKTTYDYLLAIQKYSGFDVDFINVTHVEELDLDLSKYDAVFNNYCARYAFHNYVDSRFVDKLKSFGGVKILAVQDEYDHTNLVKNAIRECGFDVVLTCVPQTTLDYVYPREDFPNVEFITVFTGYVPDDFAQSAPPLKPLAERPIFIGYRGRDIGGRYGRLGFDKYEIGRRMKEICEERGIAVDIAVDEESRIYGPAWMEFIGNCRAMLGSESGSNVFDFDGAIATRYQQMTEANGGRRPSYEEFLPVVADRDGEIEMGQISPRVFECALMRTPMILFKGRYSDVLVAGEHFIPLEKDFSNVDEVFEKLKDLPALEAMSDRAYLHLVGSGDFGYKAFLRRVREAAERAFLRKQWTPVNAAESDFQLEEFYLRLNIDRPHAAPDAGDMFRIRLDARLARLLEKECDRLDGIYDEAAEKYFRSMEAIRPFAPAPAAQHTAELLPSKDSDCEPPVDAWRSYHASALRAQSQRNDYLAGRAHAFEAAQAAFESGDMTRLREMAAGWREIMQARYAAYTDMFTALHTDAQAALGQLENWRAWRERVEFSAPTRLVRQVPRLVSRSGRHVALSVLQAFPRLKPVALRVAETLRRLRLR